ncbi:DNA polymerase eta [Suillus subaureus]|uniref:DNA polymerase eta n=1 Tax=Suillus subaureus TaxID=48587 RepID=A0A9P7EH42_9AGAM|nr:DNA polymerase eta [Suillus subaureus]KAG1821793.1 DNA polymerase eta [Suillus subaureus]
MNSPWKGKAKATNQDYDDLRPTITYRHLLSNNLGVRDPLRVVALCDSDAFYAACERIRLELDPSVPIVVQQWESLIAVSYPAREFGISRMDKIKDAKKKCPNLLAVHVATYKEGEKEPGYWTDIDTRTHKVSLDLYRRESNKIISMFKEALPTGEVEKASIDEAFIDFTRPVREQLLERYPYIAQVPVDAPNGIDSPLPPPPPIKWDDLGTVILPEEIDSAGEQSNIEVDGDATWHDVALSIAAELMRKIREDIHSKLGYTTSAGIARNKFLAKLCASYKKPNSQTILRNRAIPDYLHPLPFQKIRFLGGKLGDALAKEYDVSTVGDLLTVSLDEIQSKFGENALWVYEFLRGIDRTEVKEKSALFKSMLASKNLPKPIIQPSDGHQWIRILAAELALRLNDARVSMPTLWPKSIVLHARKGYETSRSKQATFPFVRNVTVDVIATAADKLWKDLTDDAKTVNITSVQLAFTGLEKTEMGQKSIEGFFTTRDVQQTSLKRSREDDEPLVSPEKTLPTSSYVEAVSFKCTRCRKTIALREDQATGGPNEVAQRLATLRSEHGDFHFAQDLAHSTDGSVPVPRGSSSKRKKVESEGIAKFFIKK